MKHFFSFLLALSVLSCSNGGPSSGPNPQDVTGLGGLSSAVGGTVVFSGAGPSIQVVQLATGATVELPIKRDLWPSRDGSEWAGYEITRRIRDGEDDLVFYNAAGKKTSTLAVRRSIQGKVQLSPDRSKILLWWSDEANGESFTNPNMTVWDRDAGHIFRNFKATAFTWYPDGRILYAEGKKLFQVAADGTNPAFIAELPAGPSGLNVSRDGKSIAFSLPGAATRESHVWVMKADGTNLRQLTTSALNEMDPYFVGSDDKAILLREMVSDSLDGSHGCPRLYLVSTASTEVLDLRQSNDSRFVRVRTTKGSGSTLFDACPFSAPSWVPSN